MYIYYIVLSRGSRYFMKWCEAFEVPDDATVGSIIGIYIISMLDDIFVTIKWFVVSNQLTIEITEKIFMYIPKLAT